MKCLNTETILEFTPLDEVPPQYRYFLKANTSRADDYYCFDLRELETLLQTPRPANPQDQMPFSVPELEAIQSAIARSKLVSRVVPVRIHFDLISDYMTAGLSQTENSLILQDVRQFAQIVRWILLNGSCQAFARVPTVSMTLEEYIRAQIPTEMRLTSAVFSQQPSFSDNAVASRVSPCGQFNSVRQEKYRVSPIVQMNFDFVGTADEIARVDEEALAQIVKVFFQIKLSLCATSFLKQFKVLHMGDIEVSRSYDFSQVEEPIPLARLVQL